MRVLHLCPDYPYTALYGHLIGKLSDHIDNIVYIQQSELPLKATYPIVYLGRDFGFFDRLLFFRKQYCVINDIKHRKLTENIEVIHAHTLFSSGYEAYKLKKEYGVPYVVAVRNTDVNVFFHYMPHLRHIGVKVMLSASAVIFLSPAYQNQVIKQYVPPRLRDIIRKKSYVIPNGIDDFYLNNTPDGLKKNDNKSVSIIYVGEISHNKNLPSTLKACYILKNRGYQIKYRVVGKILDSDLNALSQDPIVEYHNYCDKSEIINYYRESDVFVMPSLTETFGLVYAEALSQGLPIIYSKGQGIDGYFEEGYVGYHVVSKNAEEIANSIEQIIADLHNMSERAILASRRFNWSDIALEYVGLYKLILNNK